MMDLIMGVVQDAANEPRSRRRERTWWLEFECDGVVYTWRGAAASEQLAEQIARQDLADREGFNRNTARLTACLER